MEQIKQRQNWMAVLAKASADRLEQQLLACGELPSYTLLRSPEVGLVMVQGRVGGTGHSFCLGEMTMTRCVVQLQLPNTAAIAGFAYVAGQSTRHAELAAVCDALLQHPDWSERIFVQVIEVLIAVAQVEREEQHRQVESTRVNFFTMARGESSC